jgi:membrane complex biogenesis BtpA family protein
MKSIAQLFGDKKPLIAMVHVPPLPGTPLYDADAGMTGILEHVQADMEILQTSAFDAFLFCNEGDRPYSFRAGYDGVAAMTRVVSEFAPHDRLFGVDFLWDSFAALAVAAVTGASFMRCVATGAYESDMGLWNTDAGALLREQRRLDAQDIAVLMNVTPEFASSLGKRTVGDLARSAIVSSLADAILVSGPMAGAEPTIEAIAEAKKTVGDGVPVFANTGTKSTNVASFLKVSDGIIVGSDLKRGGYTWNPVEAERVRRFVQAASE